MAKHVILNNGHKMPLIGLGTWKSKVGEVTQAVITAINQGYRHIDCASIYGNEKEIGEALKQVSVKREDLFLTSKLWCTHHSSKHVKQACEQTLKDLQTDYLDLYLIHWPLAFEFNGIDLAKPGSGKIPNDDPTSPIKVKLAPVSLEETWRAMEDLVQQGLVRSIGVSNFSVQSLLNVTAMAKIQPAVNQVEVQPYMNNEQLIQMGKHLANIVTTGYSPFGNNKQGGPLLDETIAEIGRKYKKTAGQTILRWNIQRGVVVIPKSVNEGRIAENLDVFDFELSDQEMQAIHNLNKNQRFINPVGDWGIDPFI